MKLKIEKSFSDKVTDVKYKVGEIIEVGEARGKELLAHPLQLVTLVEEEKPKAKTSKK